jgi:photosynthetic reaction center cytochrome c subunit
VNTMTRITTFLFTLGAAALLAGCERPPIDTVQSGYRGTAMEQVYNPRLLAAQVPLNQPPPLVPQGGPEGPKAKDVLQNVKVLGDLSVAQFTNSMVAITAWVSPKEGCNYCHVPENMADDSKYTKIVSRRMLEMTQKINAEWTPHVAATGVTCYTCHRGEPVPSKIWFTAKAQDQGPNFIGNRNGQNAPVGNVKAGSLDVDPLTPYLKDTSNIRVVGKTTLPSDHVASIQATERTYSLMVHMSSSLGVNCTYCHNSRNFGNWAESPPQRTTAWHGIRMVNDLNNTFLEPLTSTFPASRLGPTGDVAKVSCVTCHQGAYKPLYGAAMAKDYPAMLRAPSAGTAAAPTALLPAPVAEALRSVLYFDVGSPVLKGDQAVGLEQLVQTMKARPGAVATISGYHSAAGTVALNHELAKQRAFTVRDSLKAAGIEESRVVLSKPQQTEANVAGEDPTARRVEVTIK